MSSVVVVESPAKAKTINKYLGSDYTVLASYLATRPVTYLAVGLVLLAFIRHRDNIIRLMRGQESRLGKKASSPSEG